MGLVPAGTTTGHNRYPHCVPVWVWSPDEVTVELSGICGVAMPASAVTAPTLS